MKRVALLLVTIATVLLSRAAEITAAQASAAVQSWMDGGAALGRRSATVTSAVTVVTSSGARLHVVKLEEGGFAVTPADDRIDPIIAFVPSGDELVQSDANPLWVLLSGDIEARERAVGVSSKAATGRRAALLSSTPSEAASRAQARWASLLGKTSGTKTGMSLLSTDATAPADIRVDSFVQSKWNQSTHNNYINGLNCYNYYTPSNYVCGCVATAGAQLMRYWVSPAASVTVGPRTFSCAVDDVSTNCTMMGGSYDWGNMPLVPANGVTEIQCQAIGKLTYDVGVSVGMNWTADESGANVFALVPRLMDTFGYANAAAAVYLPGYYPYSLAELQKAVIPNCDARAPLIMSITGYRGGHAVLVDGYGYSGADFYVHVNFGFGGSQDAWYLPPDISDYTIIDGFVFNIFPQATGSILSGRVLDASGAPIAGASVTLKNGTGTSVIAATSTDEKGIYAFTAAADHYLVTATFGTVSADCGVTLAETTGTALDRNGGYYDSTASIGNSFGNDIVLVGVASSSPPVFSPESCLFYPSTNVTINCNDSAAVIRYTLDGSDPDATSTLYSGPIFVDDTVTIKARAFESGKNPSAVVGATYTYNDAAGPPKGDYFDNPIKIYGESGMRVINDNSRYTVESGEPFHTRYYSPSDNMYHYYNQYRTVWYQWTAPGSGTMTIRTFCYDATTLYPTVVAVYTGDTLSSVSRLDLAITPDETDSDYATSLSFSVEQGVTYRIVGMMGNENYVGTFTLSWEGNLADPSLETCTPPVFSPESCQFYPSTNVTINCVDSTAIIRYTLDGSNPDATSSLYSGPIYVDDTVTIKARAFESGKNPSAIATATYTYASPTGHPKGDDFNEPFMISGASGIHVIDDNTPYTVESGEPLHTLQDGRYYYQYRTVWYQWTAPGSGMMTFRTSSTDGAYVFHTFIAVYTGGTLTSASRIAFSTTLDSHYITSLSFSVEQGVTYRIVGMMGNENSVGKFTLSWDGDLVVRQTETMTTPVPVPHDWLGTYYPSEPATDAARELLAYSDTDGDGFTAWEEYVINSDPTNAASQLSCDISIGPAGVPIITVEPPNAREGFPRILQGKTNLTDGWTDVSAPSATYRFYRVRINLGD